ncbi:MAG: hypothetical protein SPL71_05205 [Oribacterium sp.]|nr:hypothetical protein [Oribacterium sp.]
MIRTIKFDDNHSVEMSSNIGWLLTYRSQFGKDILPDLMPVIESLVTLAASLFDGSAEITADEVIAKIDRDALSDLYLSLSNLEFTTIINIAWALAKTADDSIAAPEEWVKQFDVFPFDTLIVEMFKMIAESSVSTKNWRRLQNLMKTLKPSISTSSSSQPLTAGLI